MEESTQEFKAFLKASSGQKEVGLAIAQDRDEISEFSSIMEKEGLERSDNALDLLSKSRTYLSINENMSKEAYDFLVQYPTGQVEIFDSTEMKSKSVSPNYENGCIIFLVIKEDISKLREKGWDILANAGLAYQSKQS